MHLEGSIILVEKIAFETIAFYEVLKSHENIDDEVEKFYKRESKIVLIFQIYRDITYIFDR